MRILFVHGTGVRRERFDALFKQVSESLQKRWPEADIPPCYWGDMHGATLGAGGKSIPGHDQTRGAPGGATPSDQETAEWHLLLADPLCEMRVLAEVGSGVEEYGTPGVRAAGRAVADRLAELPPEMPDTDALAALLRATGLSEHYSAALSAVAESDEFAKACANAGDSDASGEVTTAAARAVVACLLAAAGESALCTGSERDALVNMLTERLGGTARGPLGKIGAVLGTLALRVTTQPALNHWRGRITTGATPAVGDILRYQARGGPLRDYVRQTIAAEPGPTVVIGHSLGGIALVDVLALAAAEQTPLPGLKLLVTVGSQAPFLHELGALTSLAPGDGLPTGFPTWLNIYDRQDLLAYQAQPIFPADARVTDYEVSSRQPFPVCHSAYWKLDPVYDRIAAAAEGSG
ncbi:hypothetical protein ACIQU4_11595 [Streptomyces sp. NPDC090741]|uniref:hypothetical protein n=1 Tax=Streptomyces sp. NPDC090741 TaxID=3365967 RepID=UPI0038037698